MRFLAFFLHQKSKINYFSCWQVWRKPLVHKGWGSCNNCSCKDCNNSEGEKKKRESNQKKLEEHRKEWTNREAVTATEKKDATVKKVGGRAVAKGKKDQVHRRKKKQTKRKLITLNWKLRCL